MKKPFSAAYVPAIKTATKQAIAYVGGIDAAACVGRVGRTQFSEYSNRARDAVIPLDVALDLDHCAEHPFLLHAMAQALGYAAIPLHVGPGDFGQDMSEYAIASGDIMATAMRILEDGVVDRQEAQEIAPKMMHAKQLL
ncbi:MAG: phage regulatory CII family protein, partial [Acetobacter sp.]